METKNILCEIVKKFNMFQEELEEYQSMHIVHHIPNIQRHHMEDIIMPQVLAGCSVSKP